MGGSNMRRKKRTRIFCFYVFVTLFVSVTLSLSPYYVLSAEEKDSGFVFNPQSAYWPTDGWKTTTPEKQGMSSEILIKIFDEIEKKNLNIISMLIIRNGYIVVEDNSYHPKRLHSIYSSTKSIVSAIFGIALTEGYIKNVDQSLLTYFPELSKKNDKGKTASITLKNLLTMSSGLDWPELQISYYAPNNPAIQMLKSPDTIQYILNKPVKESPGQRFNYNSGCSHLLLAVIKQTGLDVANFAQEYLFSPLGIHHYVWDRDSNGIPNGGYGLSMIPRDMAKFGYLYLKGGNWNGRQIIPTSWIIESTKKQIKMNWGGRIANHYGFQWYIHSFGFHSLGYLGQYIIVVPKQELVAVFTSNLKGTQMGMPIDLVKSYIIPAVKADQPLPENEEAVAILKTKSRKI